MKNKTPNTEGFIPTHGGYKNLKSYQKAEIIYDGTNVARASLEELLIDYQDFLRTNKLPQWDKEHKLTLRLRELNKIPDATYETFKKAIENESPEICANTMIGLIKVASFLLMKQIKSLEKAFLEESGLRERMTKARLNIRNKGKKGE